jgi:hypothetical protein
MKEFVFKSGREQSGGRGEDKYGVTCCRDGTGSELAAPPQQAGTKELAELDVKENAKLGTQVNR